LTSDTFIILTSITLLISHHIMAYKFHLYNRMWHVASIKELLAIAYSVTLSLIIAGAVQLVIKGDIYVRLLAITWLLHIVLIGSSRFVLRIKHDQTLLSPKKNLKRVLVIGAGEAGTLLVRSIKRDPFTDYKVVAIVDDDMHKQHLKLMDVKVYGTTNDIPRIVKGKRIDEIFIAIPSLGKVGVQHIYKQCLDVNAKIRVMPKIEEIITGKKLLTDMQEVKIEDLLGREEVELDMEAISNTLVNKIVLITGAGGSIGSEICRQVTKFKPRQILLLGHGENSVYKIHTELVENNDQSIEYTPIIADIQDRARIFEVIRQYRPDIIYHAAAHKHVPLMESNPSEAIKNNIFGTKNVAEAAHQLAIPNFVMISTDKAVNPPNIMGATKRIAEMIIQNLARTSATNFAAVRFGNVLGSRGSVVPRFQQQLAAGGPITVTHPDMTRYFMTIPESARLVLQAGTLAKGGEVFVLNMGEPKKIVDLAKNLIRLSGYTEEEIGIEFCGIRPGEKMYEELLNEAEIQEEHVYPNIHVGRAHCPDERLLMTFLSMLEILQPQEMKQWVIEMANGNWSNHENEQPKTIA
ncbi:MAG: nucleoside-diphosphate sugar epimerase/dehydratase, partial [Lysinibacillus sp.]